MHMYMYVCVCVVFHMKKESRNCVSWYVGRFERLENYCSAKRPMFFVVQQQLEHFVGFEGWTLNNLLLDAAKKERDGDHVFASHIQYYTNKK